VIISCNSKSSALPQSTYNLSYNEETYLANALEKNSTLLLVADSVDVLPNSITITKDSISIRTKGGDVESHAYKYQNLAIILDNNFLGNSQTNLIFLACQVERTS
jgi:hypothetical protein